LRQLRQLLTLRFDIRFRHRTGTSDFNLNVQATSSAKAASYSGTETRQFRILSTSKDLKSDLINASAFNIAKS